MIHGRFLAFPAIDINDCARGLAVVDGFRTMTITTPIIKMYLEIQRGDLKVLMETENGFIYEITPTGIPRECQFADSRLSLGMIPRFTPKELAGKQC